MSCTRNRFPTISNNNNTLTLVPVPAIQFNFNAIILYNYCFIVYY